eukprot:351236-Chlamydomonas_euryale.AAC.3
MGGMIAPRAQNCQVMRSAALVTVVSQRGAVFRQSPESIAALGCRCSACDANAGQPKTSERVDYLAELFLGRKVWQKKQVWREALWVKLSPPWPLLERAHCG